jgi:hypothetical protein
VDENGNVLGLEKSHHGASEVDETVLAKAIAAAKLRHGEVWKRIEQFDEMKKTRKTTRRRKTSRTTCFRMFSIPLVLTHLSKM